MEKEPKKSEQGILATKSFDKASKYQGTKKIVMELTENEKKRIEDASKQFSLDPSEQHCFCAGAESELLLSKETYKFIRQGVIGEVDKIFAEKDATIATQEKRIADLEKAMREALEHNLGEGTDSRKRFVELLNPL